MAAPARPALNDRRTIDPMSIDPMSILLTRAVRSCIMQIRFAGPDAHVPDHRPSPPDLPRGRRRGAVRRRGCPDHRPCDDQRFPGRGPSPRHFASFCVIYRQNPPGPRHWRAKSRHFPPVCANLRQPSSGPPAAFVRKPLLRMRKILSPRSFSEIGAKCRLHVRGEGSPIGEPPAPSKSSTVAAALISE